MVFHPFAASRLGAAGIFALAAVLTSPLYAQTAQLTGRITDPTGAIVPGAQVFVTNLDTGIKRDITSNPEGYYTAPLLEIGNYGLHVEAQGFKPMTRTGVRLSLDEKARIDFVLELGNISDTITVEARTSMLDTESAATASAVSDRQYDRLPLLQIGRIRNPTNFIFLSPGVQGSISTNGAENENDITALVVNGSPILQTEILLEGMPAGRTVREGAVTLMAPPTDAIQEFKMTSSLVSAEYGHTGAAVVNFALKSGTNQFHGSAYDYLRNDKLDARNWFNPERADLRQNEFGFTLGGPALLPKLYDGRNRSFFFVSYSASRKRGGSDTVRRQVATPDNWRGDFSRPADPGGRVPVVYDPLTTRGSARDPFPGNVIPTNRLDPVAVKIAALLPEPNLAGAGALNYQGPTGIPVLDPDALAIRADQTLADRHKLTFSFNGTHGTRLNRNLPPAPLSGSDQITAGKTFRASYNYFARPNLFNEMAAGYDRFIQRQYPVSAGGNWPEKLGLAGLVGDSFPVLNFSGGYLAMATAFNVLETDQVFSFRDGLSWMRGKHTMKFGMDARRPMANSRATTNTSGTFSFNSLETALPSAPNNTGDSFASFMLGAVHSGNMAFPTGTGPRKPYWGLYAQDDFKLSQKLTLNLGFRFEFEQAAYEAADRASVIDLGLPNPGAGNLPGARVFGGNGPGRTGRRSFVDTDFSGFGPRFGLAWQALKNTVIRAGYGIYYSNNYLVLGSTGFAISGQFTSLDNGVTPAFYLRNGFPQDFPHTPSFNAAFSNGQNADFIEPNAGAMPRTQNWSFSIQRVLSANLQIEASYVGNRSTRQVAEHMVNLNQVDPKYLTLGSLLTRNINSADAKAAGIAPPYPGFTGSVAQALRPFPQFMNLQAVAAKAANSDYHGMTLRLTKRVSRGLSATASYTLSKNLGYTNSSSPNNNYGLDGAVLQDNYNRRLLHAVLAFDVTHSAQINYSYDLPIRAAGLPGRFVNDWSLSGIHRYQSGFPMAVTMANTLGIFNRALQPDRVRGVPAGSGIGGADFNPARDRAINAAAFALPAPYSFGNAAPAYQDLRGFTVLSEDFSVIKKVRVQEKLAANVYCQVLNAFNRHRFVDINTNFSNKNFGLVPAASNPRYIQLGLKLLF